MDAVDFSADLQFLVQPKDEPGGTYLDLSRGRPGQRPTRLRGRGPGELVSRAGNSFGERGSCRWQKRGWQFSG